MKHEAWGGDARAADVDLTPSQLASLAAYEAFLRELAVPRGLISRSDRDRIWERHILDGLRAIRDIPRGASVLDIGSGAGIPGVPLAIAGTIDVTLSERRRGRAAFLERVVDELGLPNARVAPRRAESLGRRFDVCVARAFASVEVTWSVAAPLLQPRGSLIYWAGSSFDQAALELIPVTWRLSTHPALARFGPLVIMGRQ